MDDKVREVINAARMARTRREDFRVKLQDHEEAYLRSRGWTYTCQTPGSRWLWVKDIEHSTFSKGVETVHKYRALMDRESAFDLQLSEDL